MKKSFLGGTCMKNMFLVVCLMVVATTAHARDYREDISQRLEELNLGLKEGDVLVVKPVKSTVPAPLAKFVVMYNNPKVAFRGVLKNDGTIVFNSCPCVPFYNLFKRLNSLVK